MSEFKFTEEEVAYIDKKLGPVIFDWAKTLIMHVVGQARNAGVSVVYMNTPETLDAGSITEGKTVYFYEKIPPQLGFRKEEVNLRGRGKETLWTYHLDTLDALDAVSVSLKNVLIRLAKQFTLQEIPSKYQGAFIGILGRKSFYTDEEIKRVLEILDKKKPKPKATSKFYYDWASTTWSGAQTFKKNIAENVVLQKMTAEMQNLLNSDDILRKFWAYILSHQQHFGPDVIGFALVSKISSKVWVINEIQTDCLNHYLDLRGKALKWKGTGESKKGVDWDTLKDMLVTQNRSKWISKMEMNGAFREQVMQNPGVIGQLPDDTQDIDAWIREQTAHGVGVRGLDLIRHFQSVNFNAGIFRVY